MTTTAQRTSPPAAGGRVPMTSLRKTALVVGVLFVITYVTSIAAKFAFYPPMFDNPDYILGGGDDTRCCGAPSPRCS